MSPAADQGKVLVVTHEADVGGASLTVLRLVPHLEAAGWRFAFWATRPSALFDELEGRGWEVAGAWRPLTYSFRASRLPPGPLKRLVRVRPYLRSLREFAQASGADLVHANTLLSTWEAWSLRRRGLPVLLHVQEPLPTGSKGRLAARMARTAGDAHIVPSKAIATEFASHGLHASIVNGAAPALGGRKPDGRNGPITVGTVGTISSRKGSDVFVKAAEALLQENPGLRFEMVGSTAAPLEADWARALMERARSAGINHRESADVPSTLASWDIFVAPSRRDPFPNTVLEAMASGLPVVGSRVDGIPEQVTPETGVLVPPADHHALAAAIRELASNSARRSRMGEAAGQRAASEFAPERQAETLGLAYRRALGMSLPAGP